jgi:hypothetical protein
MPCTGATVASRGRSVVKNDEHARGALAVPRNRTRVELGRFDHPRESTTASLPPLVSRPRNASGSGYLRHSMPRPARRVTSRPPVRYRNRLPVAAIRSASSRDSGAIPALEMRGPQPRRGCSTPSCSSGSTARVALSAKRRKPKPPEHPRAGQFAPLRQVRQSGGARDRRRGRGDDLLVPTPPATVELSVVVPVTPDRLGWSGALAKLHPGTDLKLGDGVADVVAGQPPAAPSRRSCSCRRSPRRDEVLTDVRRRVIAERLLAVRRAPGVGTSKTERARTNASPTNKLLIG